MRVENAVNRGVVLLILDILWKADPTSFPKSLYTCDILSILELSNEVLVDVSSQARLPSLWDLTLDKVVYKDEESLVNLLSSYPVLERLMVHRREGDNLTNFTVKVSSLQTLNYATVMRHNEVGDDDNYSNGSLVIDCPALINLDLYDDSEDYYCLIENNMPCLDVAEINLCDNLSDKFMRSLSSVIHLDLHFLKSMRAQSLPLSWNQPISIAGCLSSYLEIFRWKAYGGTEDEKQLMTYILGNSNVLKTVEIEIESNLEEGRQEIVSMPRISTSSRLLFPTKMKQWFNEQIFP
ncbi:hypothetical protein Bca101_054158 [Brassica carinata]